MTEYLVSSSGAAFKRGSILSVLLREISCKFVDRVPFQALCRMAV